MTVPVDRDPDPPQTLAEAIFAVQIAWWEFTETLKGTLQGRLLLRLFNLMLRWQRWRAR